MITKLEPNEVFVFGSNLAGRHGKGAALYAYTHFGAKYGEGYGLFGRSFAIPTKDERIQTLHLDEIDYYVKGFLWFAHDHPELKFLVTEIGCGLAGYSTKEIAPLFRGTTLANVVLPEAFRA